MPDPSRTHRPVAGQGPQLIAYADRFGGTLRGLTQLLRGPLEGAFTGVHVLPFFRPFDGADAGFDPQDHAEVDARLGTWSDVHDLARTHTVMADVIVNHISRDSHQFCDVQKQGDDLPSLGMFLTLGSVFPDGVTEADLARIYRPRPGLPFTLMTLGGVRRLVWTTFTSEQVDLDVRHPATWEYLTRVIDTMTGAGVRMLPPLLLHALTTADPSPLQNWLAIRPTNTVTVLDTHDGIGIIDAGRNALRPDEPGLLDDHQIDALVETIHVNSGGTSRLATGVAASNLDLYQVNCTFYDALGADDDRYLLARLIQLFLPGVPQIYYIGLLAGRNDLDLLHATGVGRDINRHHYTRPEIDADLARPLVQAKWLLCAYAPGTRPSTEPLLRGLTGHAWNCAGAQATTTPS